MTCAPEELSARGYCPGDDGHADEVADIQTTEATTTTTLEPVTALPYTGTPDALGLGAVGLVLALLGSALLRMVKSPE